MKVPEMSKKSAPELAESNEDQHHDLNDLNDSPLDLSCNSATVSEVNDKDACAEDDSNLEEEDIKIDYVDEEETQATLFRSAETGEMKCNTQNPTSKLTCSICKQTFEHKVYLSRHLKRHAEGKECKCPYCDLRLVNPRSLSRHVNKEHRSRESEQGPPWKCEFCPKMFRRQWTRSQHEKLHTGEACFQCQFCGKKCVSKTTLNIHESTHMGESKRVRHLCDICGASLSTRSGLITHRRLLHPPDGVKDRYQCEICGNSYSKKSYLTEHIKAHRTGTVFECNHCDKTFNIKTNLRAHHKRVHAVPDVVHACPVCGMEFKCKRSAARHIKSHSGLKEHSCPHCDKSFLQKSNLTAHVRIHTGVKPFECNVCGRRFAQSSQMKSHLKTCDASKSYKLNYDPQVLLVMNSSETRSRGRMVNRLETSGGDMIVNCDGTAGGKDLFHDLNVGTSC